jgi:two-component system sensor histidine kinase MtrB
VESADEFGKLAVAFNEMADALQAKLTELSDAHERERRFTSDVSHELRTPVAGLISAASMLNDRLDQMDDETRHVAEILILAARNLRVLVEELMEIARLDSRKAGVVRDSVDLPDVIDDVVQTHGWDDKVRLNGDPSLTIATDRRRLERVITNLIDNGITHGRPPVSVCVRRQDSKVEIEVNDAGDGISPNDVDHIFDRFYKGDRSRSASGSGLGLAIARDNARLIGGTVTVESEVGIGPRFIVTLPVA